jgi:hypothetical protein
MWSIAHLFLPCISWTLTLRSFLIKRSTMAQFSSVCEVHVLHLCFSGSSFSSVWPSLSLLYHSDTAMSLALTQYFCLQNSDNRADLKLGITFHHISHFFACKAQKRGWRTTLALLILLYRTYQYMQVIPRCHSGHTEQTLIHLILGRPP